MIYTLTFNPALDYKIWLDKLNKNKLNRFDNFKLIGAGKGVHTSILLNNLKHESTTLGFLAGFVGVKINSEINKYKFIKNNFILCPKGNTRINIKINEKSGETELGARGPIVDSKSFKKVLNQLSKIKKSDIVTISGSAPQGIKNIYSKTAKIISSKKALLIVDSSSLHLAEALTYKPFLVKPNLLELNEFFNCKIKNQQEAFLYMEKLQKKGSKNVLLSLGSKGALYLAQDKSRYKIIAPKSKVINSSGAGDAMVGGFIYKLSNKKPIEEILKFAVACGTATTFSKNIATKTKINQIYKQTKIKKV